MSRNPSRSARTVARGLAVCTPAHAGFRPAAAALAVAAVFALQASNAGAQPTGANVIAGQASFARNGNDLVITTQNAAGTNHSAINWQSFSVPAGSVTQFNQPSASSTSINRVVGPDPSAIFGTLRSNGHLVLVNPAGIAVGTGAVVDTAGFTASTLQMSESDAIAGRMRFSNQGTSGALTVGGTIRAQGGDIVLVAPNVQTTSEALIQSDGATVLAAGQKVEITGRGLEGIHLDVQAGTQAVNLGTLQGDAVGIFAATLRHSGLVQAQAVTTQGGKVVLQASGGDALVDGKIEARAADGKGGGIDVLGERVGLFAGAALDASGANGGGQVRVGGDYQGGNAAVPNAKRTYVDADATIRADATQQGDGGRVIVWSDEATRMAGQVSARGAGVGGNGGFSEVSGKKNLEFTGWVDLRAPRGNSGTLLLDPEDVEIFHDIPTPNGTLSPTYHSTNTFPIRLGLAVDEFAAAFEPSSAASALLSDAQLNAQLAVGHVMVTTSSSLSTTDAGKIKVDENAVVTWSSGSHLALRADKGIEIEGTIRWTDPSGQASEASQGGLHLRALNGSITEGVSGHIEVPSLYVWATGSSVGDGSVLLDAGTNIVGTLAGRAEGTAARFSFKNTGSLVVGDVPSPFASDIGGGSDLTSTGALSVVASGDLQIVNRLTAGGNLLLSAGGALSFSELDTSGGVAASADAGDIILHAGSGIEGGNVSASGTFFGGESGSSAGGRGGTVTVSSDTGAVTIASIAADAGSTFSDSFAPGSAGNLSVTAGTRGGAPVNVDIGNISVQGGIGSTGTNGGNVSISASGNITMHPSEGYAIRSDGGSGPGRGGRGGVIELSADGDVTLGGQSPLLRTTESTSVSCCFFGGQGISAQGGSGSSEGGRGGDITVTLGGQLAIGSTTAAGGTGFNGHPQSEAGAADINGGLGGSGGNITLHSTKSDLNFGYFDSLDARGGTGGSASTDPNGVAGVAGAGGFGGSIQVVAPQGGLALAGVIGAGGGIGGLDATQTTRAASGGMGTLELRAGRNIDLTEGWVDAYRTNVTMRAGGDLSLTSPLMTSGGGVTLSAGDPQGGADVVSSLPALSSAMLNVHASIDTRPQGSGAPAPGGVTLHASGKVVIDAAAPVYTTAGTALAATSPTVGSTIAGVSIDIAAPEVSIAPASSLLSNFDTQIAADTLTFDGTIANSGPFARTVLTSFSSTRAIRLGGVDDGSALHISQDELARIHSPVVTIGSSIAAGGIRIDGPITLDETFVPQVALVNAGSITQGAGSTLTAGSLSAIGGSVRLDQVAIAHTLAGRSLSGAFEVDNLTNGTLGLGGSVGDTSGILGATANSPVLITSKGRLRLDGVVQSSAAGNAVVLSSASLEMGQGGINTPSGRWLVYLPGPDGNQFANQLGKLDSGNVALWNRSFDAVPPSTITEGGNRYVFALQPQATITGGSATKVYDGTPDPFGLTPTATGLVDPARFGNVFLQDTLTGAYGTAGLSKNVGTYALTQGTLGIAGYATNFIAGTLTITPRPLNVSLTARDKVYDGTTAATVAVSADNRIAGDQLTLAVSGRFADKNAGTAKAVGVDASLSGADAGNYVLTLPTQPQTASITPRALTISASAQDKVYDGGVGAVVRLSGDGIAGDSLSVSANAAFSDRNAGSDKSVSVALGVLSGSDAGNYVLARSTLTTHASITPRPLHVILGAQDKVYDGGTDVTVTAADDRIAGDALSINAVGSFSDKNVGANKLVTTGIRSVSGADAGNYTLVDLPQIPRASITPRTLNVSVSPQDKVYDGNTAATLSSGDNRIAGDRLTVAVAGRFGDKNVGTAKTVSVDALLFGADAGNYVLALPAQPATASITPRTLHVTASARDKVYDGQVGASVDVADDRIAGDALTLAANAAFADANAGTGKSVSVQVGSLAGGDAGNYLLTQPVSATASITPAALTITARDASKVEGNPLRFNGNEFTTSGLVGSETVASVTLASDGADAAAKANRYAITPSAAVGGSGFLASNYDISYRNGVLTVLSPASPAATQVNNQVVTFAQLFVQESVRQQQDDVKKGKDDIVVTDTACKPS